MSIIHFMSLSGKRDRATANTQVFRFILSALSLCVSVGSTTRLCRDALHAFSVLSLMFWRCKQVEREEEKV